MYFTEDKNGIYDSFFVNHYRRFLNPTGPRNIVTAPRSLEETNSLDGGGSGNTEINTNGSHYRIQGINKKNIIIIT